VLTHSLHAVIKGVVERPWWVNTCVWRDEAAARVYGMCAHTISSAHVQRELLITSWYNNLESMYIKQEMSIHSTRNAHTFNLRFVCTTCNARTATKRSLVV
jgi:hypothetical protein